MTADDRLTTLHALWSVWEAHGRALTDEQWDLSTRLGDWTVRALYAHAGAWPGGLAKLVERVRDVEPTHPSAAALLRDFNRPDGIAKRDADRVARGAREDAVTYSTAEMVEQFASTGPRAIVTARQLGPVVVDFFGLAMLRLDEAVSIGIVEATVHLLDLQRAIGAAPAAPADGLAHTAAVLTEMAPFVEYIELATGRATADLFPVMT